MNDLKKVMTDRNLHIISKAIYSYLNELSGNTNMCSPGREKMAFDLNIYTTILDKYIKELVHFGYIEVQKMRKNGQLANNLYILRCKEKPKIRPRANWRDLVRD